ncbi:hypothetical protein D3C87_232920 [compost metagenome]
MKKSTIAIIVGIIIGGLFVALGESLSYYFFPVETPFPTDRTLLAEYMENDIPFGAKVIVVVNWAVAAFLAGIVSTFISGRTSVKPMLASVGVLNILALINLLVLPHPKWMWIASLCIFIPFGLVSWFLIRKKKPHEGA